MSSNDKTRNKLMETMRMTKADSSKRVDNSDMKQTKAPQEDKHIKNKEKKMPTKKVVTDSQKLSLDPYQAVRRVWPD